MKVGKIVATSTLFFSLAAMPLGALAQSEDPCDTLGDPDGDGLCGPEQDNCLEVANADQADSDGDGVGDACEDSDIDGVLDTNDKCPRTPLWGGVFVDADGCTINQLCPCDNNWCSRAAYEECYHPAFEGVYANAKNDAQREEIAESYSVPRNACGVTGDSQYRPVDAFNRKCVDPRVDDPFRWWEIWLSGLFGSVENPEWGWGRRD